MSIYTRTGDDGSTSTFGGSRILKSSPQIMAGGSIDELSSFIGLLIAFTKNKSDILFFTNIQKDLYLIMAYLSGAKTDIKVLKNKVIKFEQRIDFIQSKLSELHSFILPQGSKISSLLNIARTVCRRAECGCVLLFSKNKLITNKDQLIIIKYLNRFSDLLFILARHNNKNDVLA